MNIVLALLAAQTVAFVDVNVVPMDRERVLPRQTVVVRDGRIVTTGPAETTAVPASAIRIDGAGRWLMPGLADMHVHAFERPELALFLAHGITTVRNLHGTRLHLAWRDSIARGVLTGPRIVTAGAILDGQPPFRPTNTIVLTAAAADSVVTAQHAAGFDLIKTYDNPSPDVMTAITRAARRHGMRVAGHLAQQTSLRAMIDAGYSELIHFEEIEQGLRADTTLSADGLARALAAAGMWVNPTVRVFTAARDQAAPGGIEALQTSPAWRHASRQVRAWFQWDQTLEQRRNNTRVYEGMQRRLEAWRQELVPALRAAGVRILAGSDAPMPGLVAGFALHDELAGMVEVGFTPWEALRAATAAPGEWLAPGAEVGVIAPGREADLLLLDANPLEDIRHIGRVAGTMVRGRWLPKSALDSLVSAATRQ